MTILGLVHMTDKGKLKELDRECSECQILEVIQVLTGHSPAQLDQNSPALNDLKNFSFNEKNPLII